MPGTSLDGNDVDCCCVASARGCLKIFCLYLSLSFKTRLGKSARCYLLIMKERGVFEVTISWLPKQQPVRAVQDLVVCLERAVAVGGRSSIVQLFDMEPEMSVESQVYTGYIGSGVEAGGNQWSLAHRSKRL